MAQTTIQRTQNTIIGDRLCVFILDDDHVRDHPFYDAYNTVTTLTLVGYSRVVPLGSAAYDYNDTTEQMTLADPVNTGDYASTVLSACLVPDDRSYGPTDGCRDVFAQLRVVEALPDLAENLALQRVYVKTSVNRQIVATSFDEVPLSVVLFEDNSNIPSYSETDYVREAYNYLDVQDVNGVTDPDLVRVGPIKNFFVHDHNLDGVLGKSFSFEIDMNSEGTVFDAKIEVANRKEAGNAS